MCQTSPAQLRVFWSLFVALTLLVLQFHGPLGDRNDDVYHRQVLSDQSLLSWVAERYATWSARVVIDAVTVLVIPHAWLWRLLNAALLALLFWSIAALLGASRNLCLLLGMVAAFFLLDSAMVAESVWWMTGSFNYLWPAALGALSMLPFARPEQPTRIFLLTIPAVAYAAFHEQAVLLLIAFQCILGVHLVQQRRWQWGHVLQIGVTLCCAAVMLSSPGARRRYAVVIEHWLPDYGRLSLPERLFSGLQLALGHAFAGAGWLLVLLLVCMLCWGVLARRGAMLGRVVTLVPLAALLAPRVFGHLYPAVIASDVTHGPSIRSWLAYAGSAGGARYTEFWIGDPVNAAAPGVYGIAALMAALAIAVAMALWMAFDGRRSGHRWPAAWAVLVWLAALASTVAVGLSPSLYASSQRIYFTQDMLVFGLVAAVFLRTFDRRRADG